MNNYPTAAGELTNTQLQFMQLLDGKLASAAIKEQLTQTLAQMAARGLGKPHLAAVLVGDNGASETYVASKVKNCADVGFESSLIRLPATATQEELLQVVSTLNKDAGVHGILVQLPLPGHMNEAAIIKAIDPNKDVDGFHPINAGLLMLGQPGFVPATPLGIMLLLRHYGLTARGKQVVVIGRSNIVGRPMSVLLSANSAEGNGTVTLCHSHTANLEQLCRQADVVVAALGRPGFVLANMIKPGAVVIDVGITRVADASKKSGFRIAGDVDFDSVSQVAGYLTPVPGGVGLMTIAALLTNTLEAWKRQQPQ